MNSIDLSILSAGGGFNWYGFLIATGIVAALIGCYFAAKKRGMEGDIVVDMLICSLPLAIIGARLYHVIFSAIEGESWSFKKILGLEDGGLAGLAIYGGLFGAIAGCGLFHAWHGRKSISQDKRVTFWQILDLGFTFMFLGQAIGRMGNLVNREGYGDVITNPVWQWSPFGTLGKDDLWHYSLPLYEALWNLVGFGVALYIYCGRFKCFDGFSFAFYSIYYGIGRVWIESIRVDDVLMLGGARVSVIVSVLFIVAGIAIIVTHIVRAKKAGKKPFLFVERKNLGDGYFGYSSSKLAHPMPNINGKSKKQEIYVDESGLAIKLDAQEESVADGDQTKAQPKKEKPTEKVKTKLVPEDVYEDKWDD